VCGHNKDSDIFGLNKEFRLDITDLHLCTTSSL